MARKITKAVPAALQPIFNFSLRAKYIFLALTGFIFYANSIPNNYAFDDAIAIGKNAYVQMGLRGIPKILTHDSWASYYAASSGDSTSSQLTGEKRFSPLSKIIFAIEQQFFGNSSLLPHLSHLVNVLAYMACIVAIFYFFEKKLLHKIPRGSDVAFTAAFLFAIHPLHTEVVANIKSLDEILSLLFIMLTFIYSLKYLVVKKNKYLFIGSCSFLLALLSKEYAVTLLFFIPFLFYLLEDKAPILAIKNTLPYVGIFLLYLLLRYNAVGFFTGKNVLETSLLNNPYLYATHARKIATEWFVLGKYLGLLFFPYPLACDYSYNQIPYHTFSDIAVLLSLLVYIIILIWGIKLAREKSVLSFAVFFFLFPILLISNLVIDIGPTLGERLAFHSSLGFVIILSNYLFAVLSKLPVQTKRRVIVGVMSVIGVVCFGETVTRNAQWKDETTLFIHDVKVSDNSFLVNSNAGWAYLSLSEKKENSPERAKTYLDSARKCLMRSWHLNPEFEVTYLNLGAVYLHLLLFDSVKYCLNMAQKLNPNSPGLKSKYDMLARLYFSRGVQLATDSNQPFEGAAFMKKALLIDSANAEIWYDLGIACFQLRQYDSAAYAFTKTLQNHPDSADAANAEKSLKALSQLKAP